MPSKENLNLYITMINVHLDVYAIRPHKPLGLPLCIFGSVCSEISIHINIYVITWIVPLCYYNGHIRNPLTSVLFLIKTWHKRYLFVKDELINTYRLLSLDYHLFGMNI